MSINKYRHLFIDKYSHLFILFLFYVYFMSMYKKEKEFICFYTRG